KDGTTKKNLAVTNNEFIESLHHRSWIVQLDQLKQHRRNDAETLLSIFDLGNRSATHHTLQVNENDFPQRYIPVIRRLRMASESADVQTEMEMEDDFMKELQDKERDIAKQRQTIEEDKKALKEKEKTIKAKDKTIEEKDRTIEAKDKTIKEDKKTLKEKDKTIEEKDKLIKELKEQLAKSRM
ncbi:MAG: hypothetical protein LBL39_02720, partial [Planctomycetaceae bacterium]|nr:hypothetical protein [Planctomycetaceae bacterium]